MEILSPQDYGAHPQSWAIVHHPNGRLYVANVDGILEYDGVDWRRIGTMNRPAMSLDLAPDGRIYVGLIGSVGYLAPDAVGNMDFHSLEEELPEGKGDFSQVWRTWVVDEAVYFGANERVLRYDGEGFTSWTPDTGFHLVFAVGDQVFVREREQGLKVLRDGEFHLVPNGERFAESRIDGILPWVDDTLLVAAGQEGIFIFDGETFQRWGGEAVDQAARAFIYSVSRLRDGGVAAGTVMDGVYIFDETGQWVDHISRDSGLPTNAVNYVTQDRQGGLWVALDVGLARVDVGNPVTRHDQNNGLEGIVSMVHRDGDVLYAGTGEGLFRLEPGPRAVWHRVEGIQSQTWDMLRHDGRLLVANHAGVFELEDNQARPVYQAESPVLALIASPSMENRIYLGTSDGLEAMEYRDGSWQGLGSAEGLSHPVPSITLGPDGDLWLETLASGALRVVMDEAAFPAISEVVQYDTDAGLTSNQQVQPTWVGDEFYLSGVGGLFAPVEGEHRARIPEKLQALFSDPGVRPWSPYQDQDGRIWMQMASDDPRRAMVGFVQEADDGTLEWHSPPVLRWMDDHFLPGFHADEDGVLWFAGDMGLFRLDSTREVQTDHAFPVRIREIMAGDGVSLLDSLAMDRTVSLPYEQNRVRVEFAAPSFVDPGSTQYQVRLEGLDDEWSDWRDEPFMSYTSLWEGPYRFQVRARDLYGNVSEMASVSFRVLPPWYRTIWAYAAYAVMLGLLLWLLMRWRLARLEAQKRHLQEEVAQRTRQLEEATVTDQLTGLRNRRYLEKFLSEDLAGVRRRFRVWRASNGEGPPPDSHVFFLIDIDHFKQVNDKHGHSAGDRVLEQFGELLTESFRPTDLRVRWGGEEFLVIARALPATQALALVERLRQAVAKRPFHLDDGKVLALTCSIGFASFPPIANAPDTFEWLRVVDLADACLYTAKAGGRNRSVGVAPDQGNLSAEDVETMLGDPPRLTPVAGATIQTSPASGTTIQTSPSVDG